MKRKLAIILVVLVLVGIYLISTAVSVFMVVVQDPTLIYYDSLLDVNISGSWNISDPHCEGFYYEFENDPIIPREIIRRCFIKDSDYNTTG